MVYDLFGALVSVILNHKSMNAGEFSEKFDLSQQALRSGLYFYRLITDEKAVSRKMIVN
jgi:hypothetical protein